MRKRNNYANQANQIEPNILYRNRHAGIRHVRYKF
jgi:hypothetical protein